MLSPPEQSRAEGQPLATIHVETVEFRRGERQLGRELDAEEAEEERRKSKKKDSKAMRANHVRTRECLRQLKRKHATELKTAEKNLRNVEKALEEDRDFEVKTAIRDHDERINYMKGRDEYTQSVAMMMTTDPSKYQEHAEEVLSMPASMPSIARIAVQAHENVFREAAVRRKHNIAINRRIDDVNQRLDDVNQRLDKLEWRAKYLNRCRMAIIIIAAFVYSGNEILSDKNLTHERYLILGFWIINLPEFLYN